MIVSVVSLMSCQLIGGVGVYLGHRARKEMQATGEEGDGFATAGIIVGWISLVLGIVVVCFAGGALALSMLPMVAATTM